MAIKKKAARVWSPQQKAIFRAIKKKNDRAICIRARAGTGKTTTIVEAAQHSPYDTILFAAFNKKIADELRRRTNGLVDARTLHGVGNLLVKKMWPHVLIADPPKLRSEGLTMAVCGPSVPFPVQRLITRLHTYAREAMPLADRMGQLTDLMIDQELEPDPMYIRQGYDHEFIEGKALEAMQAATQPTGFIDFADQIFLPIRMRWLVKLYDEVFVDECQDMTLAQLMLAQGVCRHRMVIVGDDRQAIYGFRGADSNALDRLKTELNAEEYPLTVTYRCGTKIVELAQRLVPDFTAAPQNPEGEIYEEAFTKALDTIREGDFLLSRVNAPLATAAMTLLKKGVRARIAGRDIGQGLKALIWKMKAPTVESLLSAVHAWSVKESQKMVEAGREDRVGAIMDKAETLIALADGADTVADIEGRIDYLFSEQLQADEVVTCSSVHRAKGLEAKRVYVLRDTLRDWDEEEQNIQYVAITRAINTLVWVYGGYTPPTKKYKQAK